MKRLSCLVAALLALSACGKESVTSPTSTASTVGTVATPNGPSAPTGTPGAPATGFAYTVDGFKDGCLSKDDTAGLPFNELIWNVNIANAGPKGIKTFRRAMYHSDTVMPCGSVGPNTNGRPRIALMSGPESYAPNGHGITRFAAVTDWDGVQCGTNQYDVDTDDGEGHYQTIIGLMVPFAADCKHVDPPVPGIPIPEPACPPRQLILAGPMPGAVRWTKVGLRMFADFTVRPDIGRPIMLYLASYQGVSEHLTPQHLLGTVGLRVEPGRTYTMEIGIAAERIQVDLLSCDQPFEDLTDANWGYWDVRSVDWYVEGLARPSHAR